MLGRIKRIFKHRWLDQGATRSAIAAEALLRLQQQVATSEKQHSGEIRICVEAGLPLAELWSDAPTRKIVRQRAVSLFGTLRVWDTAHNNGVLIYLLLAERAIEVVADRGLNELVEPSVWKTMVAGMSGAFKQGRFEEGLSSAISQVSALLVQHFPLQQGELNPNELPDALIVN